MYFAVNREKWGGELGPRKEEEETRKEEMKEEEEERRRRHIERGK